MTELKTDALYSRLIQEGFDCDLVEEDTEIVLSCPLCGDDRQRLYVSTDGGHWYCFHCDARGNLYDLMHQVLDLPGPEAMDAVREYTVRTSYKDDPFASLTYVPPPAGTDFSIHLPEEYERVDHNAPNAVLNYLSRRHVPAWLAQRQSIGFCRTGMYAGRIIIPVEAEGCLFSFVARTVRQRCPGCEELVADCSCDRTFRKVLTPSGGHPNWTLYNIDAVRRDCASRLVVTEGAFDALRFPDEAVALLGSKISAAQGELLAELALSTRTGYGQRDVIVCLDGDVAGRYGARQVADSLLSSLIKCRIAELPEGTDPSSLPQDVLLEAIDKAVPYVL